MGKLFPIVIIVMILVAFYERFSIYDYKISRYIYKNKVFFAAIAVVMICFSGLRLTYNDTAAYVSSYKFLTASLNNIYWTIGENPGFQLVNILLKMFGASSQTFLMFYSTITISLYLWFIRKYSSNFTMSLFIFIAGGVYVFSFAAIKQCVAVAIALVGIDKAFEKKWGNFVLWILIATTFHTYALMFLITPLVMFKPWSHKTYWFLAGGFGFAISFRFLLGRILSVAALMGENYDANALVLGEGVNLFRLLVAWAPIVLSFIARNQIKKCEDESQNLILNFSMLNAVLMFTACFGTAFYLARLANYFAIFQVIAIPAMMKYFNIASKKIINWVIYIGYSGFAFYAYGINRSFDSMYTNISLFEYLASFIEH